MRAVQEALLAASVPAVPFGEEEEALVASWWAGVKGYRPRLLRLVRVAVVGMGLVLVVVVMAVAVMVTGFRLGKAANLF